MLSVCSVDCDCFILSQGWKGDEDDDAIVVINYLWNNHLVAATKVCTRENILVW